MAQLRRDVDAIKQRIRDAGLSSRVSGWEVDGGTVTVRVKPGTQTVTCTIFYMSESDYPSSPLMAMCADDDKLNSALESFSDYFESGAALLEVVIKLLGLELVNIDTTALEAQQANDIEFEDQTDDQSDDGYSDAGEDMAEVNNREVLETVLRLVRQWDKAESELQEAENQALGAENTPGSLKGLSMEQQLAKKRQIFAPQEAYKMLSRELKDMMLEPSPGVAVGTVNNSVWEWDMRLSDFEASSPIAQGLHALHQQHECNYVQIRLSFKRGLHPFYPPLLSLLHPRMKGPVNGALASHPVAQLQHWDPWGTQRELAAKLKAFLQAVAEVDVQATISSLDQHRPAYLPVEQCLARMEGLSAQSVLPLCYKRYQSLYSARDTGVDALRMEALMPSAKRSKVADSDGTMPEAADTQKAAWAAGTGYGSDCHAMTGQASAIWDSKHAEASQAAQDAELEKLLNELAASLRQQLAYKDRPSFDTTARAVPATSSQRGRSSPSRAGAQPVRALPAADSGRQQPGASSSGQDVKTVERDSFRDAGSIALCVQAVQSSCLLPFLDRQLENASFNDMASRASYFTTLFRVIWELCSPQTAHVLTMPMQPSLDDTAARSRSIQDLMVALKQSAARFRQVMGPESQQRHPPPNVTVTELAEEQACLDLADLILETARQVDRVAQANAAPGSSNGLQSMQVQAEADANQLYIREMRTLDQVELSDVVASQHAFDIKVTQEGAAPRARQARVGKELAGMAADLPLNVSSSVFVRVDQSRMMLWKALITGPEDTPYSGGCFEFDIYFPTTYPHVPMNVQIKTTGGGTVRFNPNLYNCGKVCLSLLGTWSGAKGETWDPNASSTLQMLISIQSLIFVDEPYFNEPGYEGTMHTPEGDKASRDYNRIIREETLHWAIYQALKSPPPCFTDIVQRHFQLRKDNIVSVCQQWIQDAKNDGASGSVSKMEHYLAEFLKLLAVLS